MWWYLTLCAIFSSVCNADITSSNYFCADMNPQTHVIIEQLMGMWYGIEIILHNEEKHYDKIVPSCPIIHLSEDKTYSTTYNPLHRDYNYGYNYGEGHGYHNPRTQYGRTHPPQDYNRAQQTYSNNKQYYDTTYSYDNRRYNHNDYVRKLNEEMRRLRLWWDENGSSIEYHLRYNISRAGFWISSGPQNGSALEPQFSHFAGTIQVIKAVGNHLVLTFCHQLPDKQLYSILLSRENKLDSAEVHGVHNLLNRKGLSTNAIKRVCNGSTVINPSISLLLMVLFSVIWKCFSYRICS